MTANEKKFSWITSMILFYGTDIYRKLYLLFNPKQPGISHKISETNSSFHEIVHYGKSFIAIFWDVFASINKMFILAARMGARLSFMKFRHLPNTS